jgi:hypothetical protein
MSDQQNEQPGQAGRGRQALRRVAAGEQYTGDEDVELAAVEPDAELPAAEQVGDLDHEGGED